MTTALKAAFLNALVALFGLGLTRAAGALPAAGLLVGTLVPVLLLVTLARALRDLDGEHPEEQRAARLALALTLVPLVVLIGVLRQLTGQVLPRPPGL